MLLVISIAALIGLLLGFTQHITNTVQSPANSTQVTEQPPAAFTLLAVNSSYARVHQRDINARRGYLTIGKPTMAVCMPNYACCPDVTQTVLYAGSDGVHMSDKTRNRQAISIAGAGSNWAF